ncbi:MAG: cyclic pyranopterin monophosphate synthase MoaC [Vulcanimicrobiota bacterium]
MNFSHIDRDGKAQMVDISAKEMTERQASASALVLMKAATLSMIVKNEISKGDVLPTARIAGIMAAKNTPSLIPLCHPLKIGCISIEFTVDEEKHCILIKCHVSGIEQTGYEMEALTGAAVAALTVYDMCKAVDREMVIEDVALLRKSGGKSGLYMRKGDEK